MTTPRLSGPCTPIDTSNYDWKNCPKCGETMALDNVTGRDTCLNWPCDKPRLSGPCTAGQHDYCAAPRTPLPCTCQCHQEEDDR